MDKLQTVYGIGPVTARDLIKKLISLGYERERFRKDSKNPYTRKEIYKMLKIKSIHTILPESARVYLKYLPDRAIPRAVIQTLEQELQKHVHGIKLTIAGSYRRNRPTSNDADIVVINKNNPLETIADGIAKSKCVELLNVYAAGPDKASILFKVIANKSKLDTPKNKYVVKSDVFMTTPNEYMYMLLYAIGSGDFNITMRAQAKRHGYLLNQRGLYKDGVLVELKNEHEIFEIIGMTYRDPESR
jgi:DNA polymerase/3'-5' exonuclease PolX